MMFLCFGFAQAQEKDSLTTILGNVYNEKNFKPVEFAHVINLDRFNATITDTLGIFRIKVNRGDTLLITSIGYESKRYVYDGKYQPYVFESIPMEEKLYEISEVEITPWGTYREFKNKFMSLETENPKENIHPLLWRGIPLRPDTIIPHEPSIMNPVSFLYSMFSDEGKEKRKMMEIQKHQIKQQKIEAKYNRELVSEITGLEGKEVKRFMDFCNFTDEYILNTKQYYILKRVKKLYKEYKGSPKIQNHHESADTNIQRY